MGRLSAYTLAAFAMVAGPALAGPTVAERIESNDKLGAVAQCAGLFQAIAEDATGLSASQRANAKQMHTALAAVPGVRGGDVVGHSAVYTPLVMALGSRDPQSDPSLAPDIEACAWIAMSIAQ